MITMAGVAVITEAVAVIITWMEVMTGIKGEEQR
jgi:hypothetical protein